MDKVYHFIAGFIIFFTTLGLCRLLGVENASFISQSTVVVAGVLKEVWDHYHPPHVADPWDVIATIAGGVAAQGVVIVLYVTVICRVSGAC